MTSEVKSAKNAYLHWCDKNNVVDVFTRISAAVDRGEGKIYYEGFLPPAILETLESRGFYVNSICLGTYDDPYRYQYTVVWAG